MSATQQPLVTSTHLVRIAVLAAAVTLVVLADAVASTLAGYFDQAPVSTAVFLVGCLALIGAGVAVALRARSTASSLSVLMIAVAAAGSLADLFGALPTFGPGPFGRGVVYQIYVALFTHLLLRWPERRVRGRVPRVLLATVYLLLPALSLIWQLTWDPRWFGAEAKGQWWPFLVPARDFSYATFEVQQLAFLALVIALLSIVVVRAVRASPARRRGMLPVTIAAGVLGLVVVLQILAALGLETPIDVNLVGNLAVLTVPVAVLIGAREVGESDVAGGVGQQVPPLQRIRERYTALLATVIAAAVIACICVVVAVRADDGSPQQPPNPAPGPALPG